MSRSLGWTWLTTRPPISISPPVMFSSPAIMRSSVDLPQPEGPTSTQNSPSSMVMSTPCTTRVEPNDLCTPLSATAAMLFARLLPVLAVALARLVHVAAHRSARRRRLAGEDRGQHCLVLAGGVAGHGRILELHFERAVKRPDALVPERLHHELESAVAGGLGDGDVECAVGIERIVVAPG